MIKMQEIDIKASDVGDICRLRMGFHLPGSAMQEGIPQSIKVYAAKFLDRNSVLRLFLMRPANMSDLVLLSDWEFYKCTTPHAFLCVEVITHGDNLQDLDGRDFVCEHDDALIFASVRA